MRRNEQSGGREVNAQSSSLAPGPFLVIPWGVMGLVTKKCGLATLASNKVGSPPPPPPPGGRCPWPQGTPWVAPRRPVRMTPAAISFSILARMPGSSRCLRASELSVTDFFCCIRRLALVSPFQADPQHRTHPGVQWASMFYRDSTALWHKCGDGRFAVTTRFE